jgi:hypothetical protein
MLADELGGEPGYVIDVLAWVPLVASSDRLDCLGKYHDGVCRVGSQGQPGEVIGSVRRPLRHLLQVLSFVYVSESQAMHDGESGGEPCTQQRAPFRLLVRALRQYDD